MSDAVLTTKPDMINHPAMSQILEIRMQGHDADCSLCGACTAFNWSVPTYNGDIVSNDFPDWMYEQHGGSRAVCERCYEKHAAGKIPTYDADYIYHGDLIHGAGI